MADGMIAFAWHTFLEGAGVLAATFLLYRCWLREKRERAYQARYWERVARRNADRAWQLWMAGLR